MKRRIWHRLHDRLWSEVGKSLAHPTVFQQSDAASASPSSVSGGMPWARFCSEFAGGHLGSEDFRRTAAVRDIVETVGAMEGRFYAARIREWGAEWLTDPAVGKIDAWGNPIRWPAFLLGSPRAFSPTTLRYLATALWLKKNRYLSDRARIVEIGVGFGGLAAMNALVSGAVTTLVDLPQVERSALRMLGETGLAAYAKLSAETPTRPATLAISNYAFTELSAPIQESYLTRYLRDAEHGVIVSNSAIFSQSIHGRSDEELVAWFRSEGIPAKIETVNELLSPGDHLNGVTLIHW